MFRAILKKTISNSLWRLLGRKNMVRFSQFLSDESRLDNGAQECGHGERMVLDCLGKLLSGNQNRVVLDVGANIGEWTRAMAQESQGRNSQLIIHAFEPCNETYSTLVRNLEEWRITDSVKTHKLALSAEEGERTFYSWGKDAGSNGLHLHKGMYSHEAEGVSIVPCSTIDRWCDREGIRQVFFAKIDAEGHDYEVLSGAKEMLKAGRIDMLQFEYSCLWISARRFLLDVFELLQPLKYTIGKITAYGIEFYDRWDIDLDRFGRGGNYLAVKPEYRSIFPTVQWWKAM